MRGLYSHGLKRVADFVFSLCALVVFGPLLLLVALLVKLTSAGPVFFLQNRAGLHGRPFRVYKFRTMTNKPREVGREILPGDAEVTRIGETLRRFKIDEMPQLINVLLGDMSIVGPRPFMPEMAAKLEGIGKKRLLVRPGLTGLAQVNGNIYLEWPERYVYDALYVDTVSPILDLKIIVKTFMVILKGERWALRKPPAYTEL
jgi:undecaprenyl phosphate N,N'-diacetylbacillosamine 1-phosphate transferase